jgi:hypothetical protein
VKLCDPGFDHVFYGRDLKVSVNGITNQGVGEDFEQESLLAS